MEKENIRQRINEAIQQEKDRQVKQMIDEGSIKYREVQGYALDNGERRTVYSMGEVIAFDRGAIDLVYSFEVDAIERDLSFSLLREKITEEEYDDLITLLS